MSINAVSSSTTAQPLSSSGQSGGPVRARRNELQAGYNDRMSALRSEFHEARRAAAGDPEKLAEVQAHFKEQKAALKTEAENIRTQFRGRVEEHKGSDDDATEPAVVADPVVAATSDVESENTLDVVA